MIKRWLKPCPRCRATHLLEMLDELRHGMRCMQCGHELTWLEMRCVIEDLACATAPEHKAA
jgi:hypothetical protein